MTGFLGKLPTVGDFISRNLPSVATTGWMDMTDAALALGVQRDGADWYETRQDAPALRFVLAPGALSDGGWIGQLRPSLDSFGRSYPITVLAPLPRALPLLAAPRRLASWFAKADIAVLSALEGSLTVERLGTVLGEIAVTPAEETAAANLVPLQFGGESVQGWSGPVGADDGAGKRAWYEMLLTDILSDRHAPTLWWEADGTGMPGILLRDLPTPQIFRALLAGDAAAASPAVRAAEAEA